MSDLAQLAEDHIRSALQRAEDGFPAFAVDSWSDPAVPGQWVVIEDDEGRRSQVQLNRQITRGVDIRRGRIGHLTDSLARAALVDLREILEAGEMLVSRPLPDPESIDGLHVAHMEFKGVWFRSLVRGDTAVLSALLGVGSTPLAEPDEAIVWV